MTRLEKRLQAAKTMRALANEINRSNHITNRDFATACIAEALAVLLEDFPDIK